MTADVDRLVSELVNEVFLSSGALARAGDDLTAAQSLSAARWLVLGALQDGPRSVAGIARARGLRRQSVRESAQRLERDGLVLRAPDPADRRGEREERGADWARGVASAASAEELRATTSVLRSIRLHLERTPR